MTSIEHVDLGDNLHYRTVGNVLTVQANHMDSMTKIAECRKSYPRQLIKLAELFFLSRARAIVRDRAGIESQIVISSPFNNNFIYPIFTLSLII